MEGLLPDLTHLALAAVFVAAAYCVFGLSGFGSGLVSIPALTHLWAVTFVLPVVALLDVCASSTVAVRERKRAAYREIAYLAPFTILGLAGGVTLLVKLPPAITLMTLGAAVVVFGVWSLLARGPRKRVHVAWCVVAGLVSGVASGLFGVGGAPSVIYLSGRIPDKNVLRATLATMLFISVTSRIVMLGVAGLLTVRVGLTALVLVPFAFGGLTLGTHIHLRLSREQFARIVAVLVVIAGVSLLVRAASI